MKCIFEGSNILINKFFNKVLKVVGNIAKYNFLN